MFVPLGRLRGRLGREKGRSVRNRILSAMAGSPTHKPSASVTNARLTNEVDMPQHGTREALCQRSTWLETSPQGRAANGRAERKGHKGFDRRSGLAHLGPPNFTPVVDGRHILGPQPVQHPSSQVRGEGSQPQVSRLRILYTDVEDDKRSR